MSAYLIAILALTAPPAVCASPENGPSVPHSEQQTLTSFRAGKELSEAVGQALREWAQPTMDNCEQAARELLVVYRELQADSELADRQRERLRTKVRGRLLDLAPLIRKRDAIQARLARREPETLDLPEDKGENLGQFGVQGQAGQVAVQQGFGFGQGIGGQGGNPQGTDNGQALIDLIHATISPHSWDVNGGPGSMYYWAPGHAIIVRQTGEVHDQLGDVLDQMRRMGQ